MSATTKSPTFTFLIDGEAQEITTDRAIALRRMGRTVAVAEAHLTRSKSGDLCSTCATR